MELAESCPLVGFGVSGVEPGDSATRELVNSFIIMRGDIYIRGPFAKFVDWRQCAALMQRKVVTYAKL
jgi:hypothetical protein